MCPQSVRRPVSRGSRALGARTHQTRAHASRNPFRTVELPLSGNVLPEARPAGADFKRHATKWRCPTGECTPASVWIKADRLHPLIPRESERSRKLYRSRGSVEREFGRLKHEWALLPLRVRGLDRVRLHADLTILAKLACRLASERTLSVAA